MKQTEISRGLARHRSMAGFVVLAAMAVASNSLIAEETETMQRTIPLAAEGVVELSNVNGSIEISGWEQNEVRLEVVKRAKSREWLEKIQVEIDAAPDRVAIHTELPRVKRWFFGGEKQEGSVEYRLKIPFGAQLKEIRSVNGAIHVRGVYGAVDLSTVNGAVGAEGLQGSARISTVNGRLSARFTSLAKAKDVEMKTVNGAVELVLPESADVALAARTVNGGIDSEIEGLGEVEAKPGSHRLEGQIGEGKVKIELRAVNGGIRIRRSES